MVKIDCLIFGYRRLKIDPQCLSELTSILIRSSLPSTITNDGEIVVRERDFLKIKEILKGRIDFSYSESRGLYGEWLKLKHKGVIISAIIASLVIVLLLSSLVWDVRVSGNESVAAEEIIRGLGELGFGVGDFWVLADRGEIESDFLMKHPNIAWININRRGTVAYVRVIESGADYDNDSARPMGYGNIIAEFDCVIDEITVSSGTAVVKPGDTVKKGDLLVAGVLPPEAGGGFCYAEARVTGRVFDTVSAEMDRKYEKSSYQGRKIEKISLNFFDFSINIFKKYGNLTNECDIIENEIEYTHLDRIKLPFSISIAYTPIFDYSRAEYTDAEITKLVSDRFNALTRDRLESADLLKIRTYGEFTDSGYRMRSEMLILREVGKNIEFK